MDRKAQIMSTDMIYGMIVFILILAIFINTILYGNFAKGIDKYDYEMDYIFLNFAKNVNQLDDTEAFITGSRVDSSKLSLFYDNYKDESIDELVVGKIGVANGIGLDAAAFDVCLFFVDIDKSVMEFNGVKYLGEVKQGTCQDVVSSNINPCERYEKAVSEFKPVLLDMHNPDLNRIIQMNLVVCKI